MNKKIIDIGANLTDPVFRGMYRGKQAHPDDILHILKRAGLAGVVGMMVTGGSLDESEKAIDICHELNTSYSGLFATVGCHPTRTKEIESHRDGADAYFAKLKNLVDRNRDKVIAIGECGLDYDRLHFSRKDIQLKHFVRHFELTEATGLPMFLHDRNTGGDFTRIIKENRHRFKDGVVHSFTGTLEEARELLDLGLYIGINGCSLKTEENLEVVKTIPVDKLMIETDCPYCEIRPSHASNKLLTKNSDMNQPESKRKERWSDDCMVKSRNEPCTIILVLHVLAKLHDMNEDDLAARLLENTVRVFFRDIPDYQKYLQLK